MATKTTRYIDAQGRVILPAHIRSALKLNAGQCVEVDLEGETIKIKPIEDRCCICGQAVKGKPYTMTITVRNEKKYVCARCFVDLKDVEK